MERPWAGRGQDDVLLALKSQEGLFFYDGERFVSALKKTGGKRLVYEDLGKPQ